jgi:hypothetical protein
MGGSGLNGRFARAGQAGLWGRRRQPGDRTYGRTGSNHHGWVGTEERNQAAEAASRFGLTGAGTGPLGDCSEGVVSWSRVRERAATACRNFAPVTL